MDAARASGSPGGSSAPPLNRMRKETPKRKAKAKPKPHPRLPNREAILSKMPRAGDSGRILEEDRS
jgi:ribosomal protein S30